MNNEIAKQNNRGTSFLPGAALKPIAYFLPDAATPAAAQ